MCPFILFLLSCAAAVFFFKGSLERYIELLTITIWPITILLALFFFRKVVTYMFFSMDEFNFFGAKGELKDITGVIEERVARRMSDQKAEQERQEEIKVIADSLEKAKASHNNVEQKAKENLELARSIFKDYKNLSQKHIETSKELDALRRKEELRQERVRDMKARMERIKQAQGLGNSQEKATPSASTDSTNETILPKGEGPK